MKRGRIVGTLAVVLVLGGGSVCFAGTANAAMAPTTTTTRCIQEGLSPIPVALRAGARYVYRTGIPQYEVRWSGKPLPAGCEARRTVAAQVTVWFPHLRFAFWEGFPIPWSEFWNGRQTERDERAQEGSAPLFTGLECPYKARARLRYEVVGSSGAVLAKRIVPAPVTLLPCPRRIRSEETHRKI